MGTSRGNHAKVLGNLSAEFAGGATNFANGQIGSSSSTAVLAVVAGRPCKGEKPKDEKSENRRESKDGKRKKGDVVRAKVFEAKGEVTGLPDGTSTKITVTGKYGPKSCAVDAKYAIPAGFPVGYEGRRDEVRGGRRSCCVDAPQAREGLVGTGLSDPRSNARMSTERAPAGALSAFSRGVRNVGPGMIIAGHPLDGERGRAASHDNAVAGQTP